VHQLKIGRYFIEPLRDQGPKFLRDMTFPTLQASDRYIQANPQIVEKMVRDFPYDKIVAVQFKAFWEQ
jgi:hypothetical protein